MLLRKIHFSSSLLSSDSTTVCMPLPTRPLPPVTRITFWDIFYRAEQTSF